MLAPEKRIQTKADLDRFLETELKKYGTWKKIKLPFGIREKDILSRHTILLRKTEYHTNNHHKLLAAFYKLRLHRMQNKYAIHIPLNCCDEGLKLMHVGPILMNGRVTVGKNCSIHIGTGLVAGGTTSEAPTLGDGVVVGFGAAVVGGVKIADYVAIGANAVVTKSVDEENVAVAGVPAKIVSTNGSREWGKDHKQE